MSPDFEYVYGIKSKCKYSFDIYDYTMLFRLSHQLNSTQVKHTHKIKGFQQKFL